MKLRLLLPLLTLLLVSGLAGADVVLVNANSLSLRKSASTGASRLESLQTYTPVKVKSTNGDWAQVESTSGKTGYVLKRYLTKNPFVAVDTDKLNVRSGPGTNHPVQMRVARNYPLYVVSQSDGWLFVMDYDGDQGWVTTNLVKVAPYVITQLEKSNIRSGVGTEHDVVFKAERGVILRVVDEKDGWLKVQHADGDEGWISSKIVFGWHDANYNHVGFPSTGR